MARNRGEIGKRRREEIIEAAVAIIAEQGLQHLSLSAIEQRADMNRGQLTYYFPTKEEILLAVFDRMIAVMHQRAEEGANPSGCANPVGGWESVKAILTFMVLDPPEAPEFHALQYTFLSQIGHREDFRLRLASLYEEWRTHMAAAFAQDMPIDHDSLRVSPRTLATFVQALLHSLAIQRGADANAFDREEMLALCIELLGGCVRKRQPPKPVAAKKPARNGASRRGGKKS